jgi:hypothetical protein
VVVYPKRRVAATASGLTDTEVNPMRTRCSAKLRLVEGARLHSEGAGIGGERDPRLLGGDHLLHDYG